MAPNEYGKVSFWTRIRLLFVKRQFSLDQGAKRDVPWVTVFKQLDGKIYVLASEPLKYGEERRAQIQRLCQ